MEDIVFIVRPDETGGYCAMAEGYGIVTQGDDLEDLKEMIRDAIEGYFFDSPEKPESFTLKFESIPVSVQQ